MSWGDVQLLAYETATSVRLSVSEGGAEATGSRNNIYTVGCLEGFAPPAVIHPSEELWCGSYS